MGGDQSTLYITVGLPIFWVPIPRSAQASALRHALTDHLQLCRRPGRRRTRRGTARGRAATRRCRGVVGLAVQDAAVGVAQPDGAVGRGAKPPQESLAKRRSEGPESPRGSRCVGGSPQMAEIVAPKV